MSKRIITFILISSHVYASQVLVRGDGGERIDFMRFTEQNTNRKSFVDEEITRLRKNAASFQIRELFINAKTDLLKGQVEIAKANFFEAVSKSLKADWNDADHILITHAYLNLAEISRSNSEKTFWITKAMAFSLGEIQGLEALSKHTQDLISELKRDYDVPLSLPIKLFMDWDKVFINGKEITSSHLHKFKIFSESYRITLLSNKNQTQTVTLHGNQLENIIPEMQSIVSGSCDNPQLNTQTDKTKKYVVFFSPTCTRNWDKGWDVSKNIKLLPDYSFSNQTDLPKKEESALKSKWFWVGVVLVGALVIANQSADSPPTAAAAPPRSVDEED